MFWTFLDQARGEHGRVVIDGPAGHHLARVLRVRPGETGVAVVDGRELHLEVTEVMGGTVIAGVVGEQPARGEPSIDITLLQSLLPNADFDAVIEAGTAVGINRFIPVRATRSVAHPPPARLQRWQTIARSAAEQSHRGRVPPVGDAMTLEDALADVDGQLLVLDPAAPGSLRSAADGRSRYTVAVGPEGGWTDGELAIMHERGGISVSLGPRILRARLAAVVAAAILVQQS